jgi:MtrB/PioB family decaheme-associated outer membrane protein
MAMRIGRVILTTALLAFASYSRAQSTGDQTQPPVTPPTAPSQQTIPALGSLDFGARANDASGDEARLERYRDLRDGAYSLFTLGKKTPEYLVDARAYNIGYRDQRYVVDYNGGRSRVLFNWLSIPINYGYNTETPWIQSQPGVLTLSDATRLAIQSKIPGVVGVPQNPAQLQKGSIYSILAQPYDIQAKRDGGNIALAYDSAHDLTFTASFSTQRKSGYQPLGASFSFNNANEIPMPLDNRTNDVSAGLEFSNPKGMIRFAWDGSWFNNNLDSMTWDNPLRLTNTTPYDPSGYSNGNGPARGHMPLPPSNSLNTFGGTALYRLPKHSTVNGTLSFTTMNQNEALIPWTTNSSIANPTVYAKFPGLVSLPRSTAEAEVHGLNALVNFTTRPNRLFGFTARYRLNDHKNLTPAFDATDYVRFDAAPENTGGISEQFDITENNVDLNATFNVARYTSLRIGYAHDNFTRTGRAFNDTAENIFRVSADIIGNQYLTIRALYDFGSRKGSGFSVASIEDGGGQPGLRYYDEADRDRNRGTLLLVVTPIQAVDVTVSYSAIKDVYSGEGHEFGLLDNLNHAINAGINVNPMEKVSVGFNYGRDHFDSLQKSRNANPPPDPTWTDPRRDWTLSNTENVNNFDLYLDLLKLVKATNIRVSYNLSDSDNGFIFGGPRILTLAAANQFLPLPDVTNKWRRFMTDVGYYFTRQVGVGVAYWYEKFEDSDFATNNQSNGAPRIDYLGLISTGYGNRPYRGNTAFVRLLYLF